MNTTQYKEPKTYIIALKNKDREPIYLNEVRGEALERWWRTSKPSAKVAIQDDEGQYQETLQCSEISWIGKKQHKCKKVEYDTDGHVGINGYRCGWGTWHSDQEFQSARCQCWEKFGMSEIHLYSLLKENFPDINTVSDITPEMHNYILQK